MGARDVPGRDPMELADRIDWVAKKAMIEGFMERKGLDWDSPQVQMLDLQYHDLRPDKGLYYLLERQGKVQRVVDGRGDRARRAHPSGGHPGVLPRRVPQTLRRRRCSA
jgi:Pup amidohydrolase